MLPVVLGLVTAASFAVDLTGDAKRSGVEARRRLVTLRGEPNPLLGVFLEEKEVWGVKSLSPEVFDLGVSRFLLSVRKKSSRLMLFWPPTTSFRSFFEELDAEEAREYLASFKE